MLGRRDRDDGVPAGLGQPGQLDDGAVAAGVRRDDEDVAGVDLGEVEDPLGQRRVALDGGVEDLPRVGAAVHDEVLDRQRVRRHQPAGPADDLGGDRAGVPWSMSSSRRPRTCATLPVADPKTSFAMS
nr:hypothetical protein [Jiangella endophytica]